MKVTAATCLAAGPRWQRPLFLRMWHRARKAKFKHILYTFEHHFWSCSELYEAMLQLYEAMLPRWHARGSSVLIIQRGADMPSNNTGVEK